MNTACASKGAFRSFRHAGLILLICGLACLRASAQSTDSWNGNSDTNWLNGGNWSNGVPGNDLISNIAVFDLSSYSNQPNAGTISIAGIQVGDGTTTTAALTLSGSSLTIGSQGLTVAANSGSVSFNTPLVLGTSQTWTNNSSNLLSIGSGVTNGTASTLTLAGSGNMTFSGVIGDGTGATSLVINTAGIINLSNYNTFTGGTTVNSGTLNLNNGGDTGTLQGILTINSGATVQLNMGDALGYNSGSAVTTVNINGGLLNNNTNSNQGYITNYILTGGTMTSTGGGTYNFNSGTGITTNASSITSLISSGITLRNNENLSFAVAQGTTSSGIDLNVAGTVLGTGSITKSGAGTLDFTGTASYSGGATVNAGTLIVGGTGSIGSGTLTINGSSLVQAANSSGFNTNPVTFGANSNGRLQLLGHSITVGTLASQNSGTPIIENASSTAATLTIGGSNNSFYYGVIQDGTGGGALSVAATGTVYTRLFGNDTYTGGTTIGTGSGSAPGIEADSNTALGTGNVVLNDGVLGGANNPVLANNVAINGTGNGFALYSNLTLNGNLTGSGTVTKTGGINSLFLGGNNSGFNGVLINQSGNNIFFTSANAGSASALWTINNNAIRENGVAAGSTIHLGGLSGTGGTIYMENSGAPITLQIGERNDTLDSYAGVIGQNTNILKSGTGTEVFTGANSYTGSTTINSGTLIGTSSTAFGNGAGAVSVASGATLDYDASGNNALTIGSLTLANGSTLGGSIGSTQAGAAINVTNAATATGNINVNLFAAGGTAPASGTYTILTGGAGSSLNTGTSYTLSIFNDTNFSASAVTASANNLQVNITAQTALTQAYWNGGLSGNSNVWAISNGSTSNWLATPGGGAQALVPSPTTDVFISTTNPVTAPTATVLGQNLIINSLTIQDTTNGLGLNADGNTLTIMAGSGSGITMNSGVPTSTIGAKVALGANQTWTNNSTNLLTISGNVSGAYALTTAGTGTINLSGIDTYTGATTVSAGTLQLGNALALPTTTCSGGSNFVINTGATVDLNNNNLNLTTVPTGTGGTITNNSATNGLTTLTFSNPSGTLAQILTDSNATTPNTGQLALALTAGSLTLNKTDTYTGGTTVNGGTLIVGNTVNPNVNLGSGTITLNGGTLEIVGQGGAAVNFYTPNNINFNGGTLFVNDGVQHLGVNSTNTQFSTINVGAGGGTIITQFTSKDALLAGILTGSGALTIQDTHDGFGNYSTTDVSNGSNTYSGTITVNETVGDGVRLSINNNSALSSATVNVSGSSSNVASDVVFSAGTDAPTLAGLTGSGTISLADQASTAVALTIGNNLNDTYSGVLSGSGSLVKLGSGTFTLTGSNSYTGSTTISNATLALSSGGNISASSGVNLINSTASFDISSAGAAETIKDLTGVTGSTVNLGANTLTAGTSNSTTFAGTVKGTGGFVKQGSGNLILSGANSYTGNTMVLAGSLTITGSLATNKLIVNGGSFLLGASNPVATSTPVTLAGGTLGITTGGGSTTLGALTLTPSTSSILDFGLGSASEVLSFSSLAGLSASTFLNINNYTTGSNQDHLVLSGGSGIESGFLGEVNFYSNNGTAFLGTGMEVSFAGGGVEIVPTPEPGTWLMSAGFVALILLRLGKLRRQLLGYENCHG